MNIEDGLKCFADTRDEDDPFIPITTYTFVDGELLQRLRNVTGTWGQFQLRETTWQTGYSEYTITNEYYQFEIIDPILSSVIFSTEMDDAWDDSVTRRNGLVKLLEWLDEQEKKDDN